MAPSPSQTSEFVVKRPQLWIGALWLGWTICLTLVVGLWALSLSSATLSLLNNRQLAMSASLEALSESFQILERLPLSLAAGLREEAREATLTSERLRELQKQAQPLCELYYLNSEGQPLHSTDSVPEWLPPLLSAQLPPGGSLTVLRPLPPGLEAGRPSSRPLPELPENYLVVGSRLDSGEIVACQLDLGLVFGVWMLRPLHRSGLENDLTVVRLSPHEPWRPEIPPPPTVDLERWIWPWEVTREEPQWRWQVETLFPRQSFPFQQLEITLDNSRALKQLLGQQLTRLGLTLALMLAFAFSIVLTARAVRREGESIQAREHFVGMVSHELRTPLAAIEMYLEILREGLVDDPEKLQQYHQILGQESARLKSLVENLLTVGTLQKCHELERESVDLHSLIEELLSQFQSPHLSSRLEARPCRVLANREALRGVLSNLLGNALKYGGAAEIRTATGAGRLILEVEDEGSGIPRDQRAKIFEPYYRMDNPDGEKKAGVGLGLALVKGLVEALDGSISVHEGAQGGALFRVSLVLVEGEAE